MSRNFINIVIVGSGGFAAEVIQYINDIQDYYRNKKNHTDIKIYGIVDNFANDKSIKEINGVKFLGKENDLQEPDNTYFVIANGKPEYRKDAFIRLKSKERNLYTLIHPSAYIAKFSEINEGSIICPNVIINSNSKVGQCTLINVFSSIGHHSKIGDFSVISPFCSLSGYSGIGERSFMGTRATLFPNIKVGDCCIVDSHSYVNSDVDDYHITRLSCKYIEIRNRLLK